MGSFANILPFLTSHIFPSSRQKRCAHLEKDSALVFVDGGDIARPDAEVVLFDVVGRGRVVVLPVVLGELERLHDPPEQDVVQLDHVAVVGAALPLEVERHRHALAALSVD